MILLAVRGNNIVRTGQHPALHAKILHQVIHSGDGLLVRGCASVDDVARGFFALVLHWVERRPLSSSTPAAQTCAKQRSSSQKRRLPCPCSAVRGFFGKERQLEAGSTYHVAQFFAKQAAFFVLLVNDKSNRVVSLMAMVPESGECRIPTLMVSSSLGHSVNRTG